MHGFSECQLPMLVNTTEYEGRLRESSLSTIIESVVVFPQQQVKREEDESE